MICGAERIWPREVMRRHGKLWLCENIGRRWNIWRLNRDNLYLTPLSFAANFQKKIIFRS